MDFLRKGSAVWAGDLLKGNGKISSESGAVTEAAFKFATRFENDPGTNPEELIAAAQAACFSMALSARLSRGGNVPNEIRTTAILTLSKGESGFKITKMRLVTEGNVPGIDAAAFQAAAEATKDSCPVSVLLKPGLEAMTVEAKLV
jgi:osmotically inducible protein OsmC